MAYKYIQVPKTISINQVEAKDFTLSASQYMDFIIPNNNLKYVRDFLDRELKRTDLGQEVGSLNYIQKSPFNFLRTKALQSTSFLPEITEQTSLNIHPNSFVQMNLKEGDLIISKDSNIGEIVILDRDYPNTMLSSAIYKLPVTKNKYYLLALIKHNIFREQLDFMVPKGSTIRHAKTMFLDCKIPIPKTNTENVIKYVEVLTKAIVNKEKLIQKRHLTILSAIEEELRNNQKPEKFKFSLPRYDEVQEIERFDTNLYRKEFKEIDFLIKNYSKGYSNIEDLGFSLSRGQNLQVSNIGQSIYLKEKHKGFYTLMLPKHLSKYGTVDEKEYLGNSKELKTLKIGDLIFGAEGFGKGRSIVIIEKRERTITNIHGITIKNLKSNLTVSIFVKCFLDFLRDKGLIDLFAVGGNGGSLAQKYWPFIPFPDFDISKKKEIAKFYHNSEITYDTSHIVLENFMEKDNAYNVEAGIFELDKTMKILKDRLNFVINEIVNDKEVNINFDFE